MALGWCAAHSLQSSPDLRRGLGLVFGITPSDCKRWEGAGPGRVVLGPTHHGALVFVDDLPPHFEVLLGQDRGFGAIRIAVLRTQYGLAEILSHNRFGGDCRE
jgi:hypothetical protein